MAFKRLAGSLALLLLAGACSSQTTQIVEEEIKNDTADSMIVAEEPIEVLCPTGAPALATLGLYDLDTQITYTQGQDELVAELAKDNSTYDVIVAPINLGVTVYKDNPEWKLESVLTWGNLYIVGEENWDEEGKTLAAFGQGAVPGLVFNNLYPEVSAEVSWLSSVAEAGQSFLAQKDAAALLAQPQAQIILNQDEGEASIVADLQQEWQDKYDTAKKGYPQAALFIKDKEGLQIDSDSIMEAISAFLESDDSVKESRIDEIGAEKLGVPNAQIAIATWASQNIDNVEAIEVEQDIETFLAVFNIEIDPAIFE